MFTVLSGGFAQIDIYRRYAGKSLCESNVCVHEYAVHFKLYIFLCVPICMCSSSSTVYYVCLHVSGLGLTRTIYWRLLMLPMEEETLYMNVHICLYVCT